MPVSADEYHERTKHTPASVRGGTGLDFDNKPIPYKIYEDLSTVSLPEEVSLPSASALSVLLEGGDASPKIRLDLDTLASLCYFANGITKTLEMGGHEHPFRAAACTGALYHIDLYPVCGDLPGLEAGVYHFDPRSMALDVLREGDHRGVLAEATGGEEHVASAPLSFVLTSTWWRNAWKYGARTYRHAFWDSGTILANLLAAANSFELPASVVTGFADQPVAELLGVDPDHEVPLELVPIGTGVSFSEPPPVQTIDPDTRPLSSHEIEYDLIQSAYASSSFDDGAAARQWRLDRPEGPLGTRKRGQGETIELEGSDQAVLPQTSLERTIRRRGSCREYTREPIDVSTASTLLDRSVEPVPLDVSVDDGLTFNDVYLLATGVDGIPTGTYQYHPDAGILETLGRGDIRGDAGHLALGQRLGADAGLSVYFLADLEAVTDRLGDRGYRAAQLEAAMIAGRLYLAAYAHDDLGATGLTFYDDLVTEFLSPRAAGQTPMFLWTMGRPA